jgi:hypothetical protein
MKIGVVFPQTEIGADVGAVRAYAQQVERMGFTHVLAYDHVLGADPSVHRGWSGPYNLESTFHEPFVLFGYLAGFTSLEFTTGIIILPQRQTALVAKQAAEVDLLCGGRLRLGVGLGWNAVEYEALGATFSDRGKRVDEQVELLRRLWTEPSVTFHGTHEHVTGAWRHCRCSGPSRCGSAPSLLPPTGAPAASATGGCRRCLPAPSSTRPGPSWSAPRSTPGATRLLWAWRVGSVGATRPLPNWPSRWVAGAMPVLRTCR